MFLRKHLLLIAVLVFLPTLGQAQAFKRGPFLQQVSPNSIMVVWETEGSTDGQVDYGLDTNYGQMVTDGNSDHHEVTLSGLSPATTYHYKVTSGGIQSSAGSFNTAPSGDEPFRCIIFGDTRDDDGDHGNHEALMPAFAAEAVDFYVNTGDQVENGLSDSLWDRFFQIEADMLRNTPFWPTFGNHEQYDVGNNRFRALFALPPVPGGGEEAYYEFRYSNSHFVVMNTHDVIFGTFLSNAQKDFITDSINRAVADLAVRHIFVIGHHGPYSSSNHGGASFVRNFIEDLQHMDQITYLFAGHDHGYERWEADSGLKGFVTGGGGASLYSQDDPNASYSRFFYKGYHYLLVEVAGDLVRVCPKMQDGTAVEPCIETGDQPGEPDGGVGDGGDVGGDDAGTQPEDDQPGDDGQPDAGADAGAPDSGTADGAADGSGEDAGADENIPADEDQPTDEAEAPDGAGEDAGAGTDEDDGTGAGCDCSAAGASSPGLLFMLGIAVVLFVRRRLLAAL